LEGLRKRAAFGMTGEKVGKFVSLGRGKHVEGWQRGKRKWKKKSARRRRMDGAVGYHSGRPTFQKKLGGQDKG